MASCLLELYKILYNNCPYIKYKYDASWAQNQADYKLISSRKGLDLSEDETKELDKLIKEGLEKKRFNLSNKNQK